MLTAAEGGVGRYISGSACQLQQKGTCYLKAFSWWKAGALPSLSIVSWHNLVMCCPVMPHKSGIRSTPWQMIKRETLRNVLQHYVSIESGCRLSLDLKQPGPQFQPEHELGALILEFFKILSHYGLWLTLQLRSAQSQKKVFPCNWKKVDAVNGLLKHTARKLYNS